MRTKRPGDAATFFDTVALGYDRAYDARTANGHALRARLSVALGLIGSGPGDVLDAGMGPGRLCEELARRGWRAHGVDASREMVEAARARLPEARERLCHAPIEELPFDRGSFDVVVATGVLEYSQIELALGELTRVLRPGGKAVVSYPNPLAAYGIWKTRVYYPTLRAGARLVGRSRSDLPPGTGRIAPERFTERLERAGLMPTTSEYTSFLALPSPLEQLAPATAVWLGERLEGANPRLGRWLGTQIVYGARKP